MEHNLHTRKLQISWRSHGGRLPAHKPSIMRRSLSRRHSTCSTDRERCRYECGVEGEKMTLYALPDADNCVIDSQSQHSAASHTPGARFWTSEAILAPMCPHMSGEAWPREHMHVHIADDQPSSALRYSLPPLPVIDVGKFSVTSHTSTLFSYSVAMLPCTRVKENAREKARLNRQNMQFVRDQRS